jgi:glycosyltransferase involved in cell wall biosynthesis
MRIAFGNASHAWGGIHRVTEVLARGMQARGHAVSVFCRPGSELERRMSAVAPVHPVVIGMDLSPLALWRCRRSLARVRPDVLLALMKKDVRLTAPAAWSLGIPVVVRHGIEQAPRGGLFGRMLYGRVPAHHVANAEATRRTLLRGAPWLAAGSVSVIYNGVEPMPADVEPADLGIPPGGVAVGFVGIFEPRKGVLDLARAWQRVARAATHAHLVLTGRGRLEPAMHEVLDGAPRVHWLGYRSDVPRVMRALDVLVLPSLLEGAPNVVLEAMAAGRAVVATAVSGTPELVDEGRTGLLVPPGDPDALATAIVRLVGDPAQRERMGEAGRAAAAERFRMDAMLDAYEALFERVVRQAKASGPARTR